MNECAREGCARPSRRDEFCSTYCAKVAHGVIIPGPKLTKDQRAWQRKKWDRPPVELDNPHVNAERHQGPAVKRAVRPGTGRR